MARADDEYTAPVQDYLKAIYEIERGTGAAATTDIAGRLAVAPASVSGMVRRLADQGLLEHVRYRGARLTPQGRRVALSTIRRHRIIEAYLAQALGYPWDLVHDEAERLEHAASDELVDRMAAAIGEPAVDPHGAPIPTREGDVEAGDSLPLSDVDIGHPACIAAVADDDPELLRYLDDLGIGLGTVVTVLGRAPFDGPVTVRIDGPKGGIERAIGPRVAEELRVRPT